jgi:glycosyltransferase involved in cell wall biosynthesis
MRVICDRFPDLGSLPVVPVPWSEATEAADLAACDVGVSWVPDDVWSRGKCGLKVLQYQAAGLPAVANPVGVHSDMIRPGVSGWLPVDDPEWVEALRCLAADPERRRQMGRGARDSVEADYSVAAWESAFVATVAGTQGAIAPSTPATSPIGKRQGAREGVGGRARG